MNTKTGTIREPSVWNSKSKKDWEEEECCLLWRPGFDHYVFLQKIYCCAVLSLAYANGLFNIGFEFIRFNAASDMRSLKSLKIMFFLCLDLKTIFLFLVM